MSREIIDIFCHWIPAEYYDAVKRLSGSDQHMLDRAYAIPVMSDLNERFALMDRFPGYRQILSLVSPPLELVTDSKNTIALARTANDAMSELVSKYPDRFPGFIAALPMNDPLASIKEAERAIRELHACGVQVFTNVNGKAIDGDPVLLLLAQMAEWDRPVWIHPIRGFEHADFRSERHSKYEIWWALGWLYETGAAMMRLAYAGIFDRWPNLKVITHHAGGVIPMAEGRVKSGMEKIGSRTPEEFEELVESPLKEKLVSALRRFYSDTATFGSESALKCGMQFFGLERMMFATDMPFGPNQGADHIENTIRIIDGLDLDEKQKNRIFTGTIRDLVDLPTL